MDQGIQYSITSSHHKLTAARYSKFYGDTWNRKHKGEECD